MESDRTNKGQPDLTYESADSFADYIRMESKRICANVVAEQIDRAICMGDNWWNPQYGICIGCGKIWPAELLEKGCKSQRDDLFCPVCLKGECAWEDKRTGRARSAGS